MLTLYVIFATFQFYLWLLPTISSVGVALVKNVLPVMVKEPYGNTVLFV